MPDSAAVTAAATPPRRPAQDWRVLVAVFWVTSLVEGLGVSQIFALLPAYLRQMGVPEADRLAFIGLFTALIFIVGMPLVPLWGVWADKYSRKAVIVRSCIVEAVVFAGVALSQEPWQLALSILLIGFQLGNTGVMLAGIRDVAPTRRLGTTIAVFSASTPIGFAVGPILAGFLIDGLGWTLSGVFWLSAVFSVGTALLVVFGSKEVRPEVVPTGRVLALAFGAVRGVLADPSVRRIFLIFGVSFVATQMSRPYIPVLVEGLTGPGPGYASAVGLVMGTAALVGGLVSPLGGLLGDRIGFRIVLVAGLAGAGVVLLLMPFVPSVASLALLAVVLGDGHRNGGCHGLGPPRHRGPVGAAVRDPQPRVSAALRGRDHRPGDRSRGRVGRWRAGAVRRRRRDLPAWCGRHRDPPAVGSFTDGGADRAGCLSGHPGPSFRESPDGSGTGALLRFRHGPSPAGPRRDRDRRGGDGPRRRVAGDEQRPGHRSSAGRRSPRWLRVVAGQRPGRAEPDADGHTAGRRRCGTGHRLAGRRRVVDDAGRGGGPGHRDRHGAPRDRVARSGRTA